MNRALPLSSFLSGVYSEPLFRSTSTECRWPKVAAPGVLADEADRVPVLQHRAEGEQLAGRPVDGVLADAGGAPVKLRLEPRVNGEPVGDRQPASR